MTTRKIDTKAIAQSSTTYVGRDGELFYDTVTNTLRISDGATAGGVGVNIFNNPVTQGDQSVNIGNEVDGFSVTGQDGQTVAIGAYAGLTNQAANTVAVGYQAGQNNQGLNTVAVGSSAGRINQGIGAVAVGLGAAYNYQGQWAIAIGLEAGNSQQGQDGIAIGTLTATSYQQADSIAIGSRAGSYIQGTGAIAIGGNASPNGQGANSIAIGFNATTQGTQNNGVTTIATTQGSSTFTCATDITSYIGTVIGSLAFPSGTTLVSGSAGTYVASAHATLTGNQFTYFVKNGQPANSILINASGTPITVSNASFYVNPVRAVVSTGSWSNPSHALPAGFYMVAYNPTTSEFIYWS
jgi:hypothetical protein